MYFALFQLCPFTFLAPHSMFSLALLSRSRTSICCLIGSTGSPDLYGSSKACISNFSSLLIIFQEKRITFWAGSIYHDRHEALIIRRIEILLFSYNDFFRMGPGDYIEFLILSSKEKHILCLSLPIYHISLFLFSSNSRIGILNLFNFLSFPQKHPRYISKLFWNLFWVV